MCSSPSPSSPTWRCSAPSASLSSASSASRAPTYRGPGCNLCTQATAHPRTPATLCTQAGVALFKGRLHYRCAFPGALEDSGEFCSIDGPDTCAAAAEGARCTYFADNRLDGPMNFDDILAASLVIMQCASFDAYTQGMYVLMRHVFSLVWLYYLAIVCIGGFFVVNLFLAVLLEEFLQAKQASRMYTLQ